MSDRASRPEPERADQGLVRYVADAVVPCDRPGAVLRPGVVEVAGDDGNEGSIAFVSWACRGPARHHARSRPRGPGLASVIWVLGGAQATEEFFELVEKLDEPWPV